MDIQRLGRYLPHRLRILIGMCLLPLTGQADWTMNMSEGASTISREVYHLHMTILWICIIIGVLVFGVMFYAIIKHRKAAGAKAAQFHESTRLEILWTAIPFAILISMAVPATRVLILMDNTDESDMSIKVTGYRWYWHYEYLDNGVNFFSYLSTPEDAINNFAPKEANYLLEVDKPLVVPVNKKIRFLTTANDVIHSFWVPALGYKKDCIPGFINESWTIIEKPGTYRGMCAELCGAKHGFMPIVIEAKSEADYAAWVASQQADAESKLADANQTWTQDELAVAGEKVYTKVCAMCHQGNGQGMPPAFPAIAGSEIATLSDNITTQIHQILYGKNAMPALGAQLSDLDVAAVVTYTRNAFGNDTGDVIQPTDVKSVRDQG